MFKDLLFNMVRVPWVLDAGVKSLRNLVGGWCLIWYPVHNQLKSSTAALAHRQWLVCLLLRFLPTGQCLSVATYLRASPSQPSGNFENPTKRKHRQVIDFSTWQWRHTALVGSIIFISVFLQEVTASNRLKHAPLPVYIKVRTYLEKKCKLLYN